MCARKVTSGLTGRRFHLGDKEVFDAETLAIYQVLKTFEARQGARRRYTIFSDCQPAIRRVMTDVLARACIEVGSRLVTAGNKISIVWVSETAESKAASSPTAWIRRQRRAAFHTASRMRSDGRPASSFYPGEPPRNAPEGRPSRSQPMYAQSKGTAPRRHKTTPQSSTQGPEVPS